MSPETMWSLDIGACPEPGTGTRFRVWAPHADRLSVRIETGPSSGVHPLRGDDGGYFEGTVKGAYPGDRYRYEFGSGEAFPDPASRFQPEGVHGPSEIMDPDAYPWSDQKWRGLSLEKYLIYELHVAAFTSQGDFSSVIPHLDYLKNLGVTAVELMPVAQFPGGRNWGYDGAYPFAVQNTYGGPGGLKQLVDACHGKGLAVILDVVYNHLGPEGNYLGRFGPYFTERYKTPWGDAINYDGPYSDEVRHYFISNALYWIIEFHVDALRIDAIHGIFDFSACHILREMGDAVHRQASSLDRLVHVIPESDLNDVRVIAPPEEGGYGLDAQWNDDFHHCLHTLLTGERSGYYADFGSLAQLEKAYREGFVYDGRYSPYRRRRHGSSSKDRPARQFVVFAQNHDQVGNRAGGDRLSGSLSLEKLRLAAAAFILSPFIPIIFMGEEYGETAPFPYFISHSDEGLIATVRGGRRMEFASFGQEAGVSDPQAETTFLSAKLRHELRAGGPHALLLDYYRKLISLRNGIPAFSLLDKNRLSTQCFEEEGVLLVLRGTGDDMAFCLLHFGDGMQCISVPLPAGEWTLLIDSAAAEWGGDRSAHPARILSDGGGTPVILSPWNAMVYRKAAAG